MKFAISLLSIVLTSAAMGAEALAATQLAHTNLAHRWGFNGNLRDSVGLAHAQAVGSVTLTRGMAQLPGGRNGSGHVSLGSDLLPKDGGWTIEVWAKQTGLQNWSRIFDMGSRLEDSLLMSWSFGCDINRDCICIKKSENARQYSALAPYDLGVAYHIAMTVSPRADGRCDIRCSKREVGSGRLLKRLQFTTSEGWSPKTQNQKGMYLGHSCALADNDAAAAYDEARIWRVALSEGELGVSARLGADARFTDGKVARSLFNEPPPKDNPITPQHSQVTRKGNWQGVVARRAPFGSYAWASEKTGDEMELSFEGESCRVVFRSGAQHWKWGTIHPGQQKSLGAAQVWLDGKKVATVETGKTGDCLVKCGKGTHTLRVVHVDSAIPDAGGKIVVHGFVVDRPQKGHEPDWAKEDASLKAAARKLPPLVFFTGSPYRSVAIPNAVWDSYPRDGKWGASLRVYEPAHPERAARIVWADHNSLIYDLMLSDDAKKAYFSMKLNGAAAWQIYSINLDGTGLRQITNTPDAHNVSPTPLPDGRIAFISSRTKGYHTVCQSGPCTHLYVMNGDGSNVQRLSSNTLSDFNVSAYGDGRLIYTRWEYVDWNLTYRQSLWTQYPDGRNMALWFGNLTEDPAAFIQAAVIPGKSEVVCTFAPHHGTSYGAIGLVSNAKGPEGKKGEAFRVLTSEFPATEDMSTPWAYCWPYPVGVGLYLCSYGGGGLERYRVSLIDGKGHRATVYDAKDTSAFRALPIVARTPPPVLPVYKPRTNKKIHLPKVPPGQREAEDVGVGVLFVSDVCQGVTTNVPLSEMRQIRIMEQLPKTMNRTWDFVLDQGPLMSAGTYYAKRVWGYAPVEDDGSAYFEVPALKEVYLQLVDGEGREIQRMTSALNVMPGSMQSCVGCHEHRATSGQIAGGKASLREPTPLKLPDWGNAGVIDYRRTVQPVFDRNCTRCHSGANPPKGLSLNGNLTRFFCMSYDGLVNRSKANSESSARFTDATKPKGLVDCIRLLYGIGDIFEPKKSGSLVSRLPDYFKREHCGKDVTAADKRIVYEWIDAMVPYYATADYAHLKAKSNRDKWGLADEKGFKPWFIKRYLPLYTKSCASCHGEIRHNGYEWQGQWGWIDLTKPEWSPALVAHLPKDAGGRALPAKGKFQLTGTGDPLYAEMLDVFREAARETAATPEADMAGFVARSVGKGEFRIAQKPFAAFPPGCVTPDGMAVDARDRLVIAAANLADPKVPGALFRIDFPGLSPYKWCDLPVEPTTGRVSPMGLAFGPEGELYVVDNQPWTGEALTKNKGRLLCLRFKDDKISSCEVVAEGMEHPNGVKCRNGRLYLTQSSLAAEGTTPGDFASGLYSFDINERNVKITNSRRDKNLILTVKTRNAFCPYGLDGIVFDAAGDLYLGNFGDGEVLKVTLTEKGKVATCKTFAKTPFDTKRDPSKTGFVEYAFKCPLRTTDGMCFGPDGWLYVADFSNNAIVRVSPDGQTLQFVRRDKDGSHDQGGLNQPGEPIFWKGRLIVSNFDAVVGNCDKVNAKRETPATLTECVLQSDSMKGK